LILSNPTTSTAQPEQTEEWQAALTTLQNMLPTFIAQLKQKEEANQSLQLQVQKLKEQVNDIPRLHTEINQLKNDNQKHTKVITELDCAFKVIQEENKKLTAQVQESEKRMEQAEIQINDMTARTKKIVQGMQLSVSNLEKTAAKDILELYKAKGKLALLEAEEETEVLMLPKDMLENWEDFALQTMKENWDQNMIQLNHLLQIPNPTCKQLALPPPGNDNDREDQGQMEPTSGIPHSTTVGQTPVTMGYNPTHVRSSSGSQLSDREIQLQQQLQDALTKIKTMEKGKAIAVEQPKQKHLILQPAKLPSSTTLDMMTVQELKEQVIIMGKAMSTMEDQAAAYKLLIEDYEKDRKDFETQQTKDVQQINKLKAELALKKGTPKSPQTRSTAQKKGVKSKQDNVPTPHATQEQDEISTLQEKIKELRDKGQKQHEIFTAESTAKDEQLLNYQTWANHKEIENKQLKTKIEDQKGVIKKLSDWIEKHKATYSSTATLQTELLKEKSDSTLQQMQYMEELHNRDRQIRKLTAQHEENILTIDMLTEGLTQAMQHMMDSELPPPPQWTNTLHNYITGKSNSKSEGMQSLFHNHPEEPQPPQETSETHPEGVKTPRAISPSPAEPHSPHVL